jgi:hypothetical protein
MATIGLRVVTDQESGNRPRPLANIRLGEATPCNNMQSSSNLHNQLDLGFLLSGDPNQYKLAVFFVFRMLVRNPRVLSLRFHLVEQLNHRD